MPSKTFVGLVNLVSGRSTLENQIFYVVTRTAQQKMTFWLRHRFSTKSTSKMHNALSSNAISYNIKVYQILLTIGKVSTPPFRVYTLIYTGEKVILLSQQNKLVCQSHWWKCERMISIWLHPYICYNWSIWRWATHHARKNSIQVKAQEVSQIEQRSVMSKNS